MSIDKVIWVKDFIVAKVQSLFNKFIEQISGKPIPQEPKAWEKDNRSFCMLPFSHFSPRADGKVKICSEQQHFEGIPRTGTEDQIDLVKGLIPGVEPFNLNKGDTLEDVWNSEFYRDLRRKMLKGQRVNLCKQCYLDDKTAGYENLNYPRLADAGGVLQMSPATQSKRWALTYDLEFVNDYKEVIQYADDNNGHMGEHLPQRYEMRLSNKCNLACRMCAAENSSLFAKEVVNNPELLSWSIRDAEYMKRYLPGKLELDKNPELIESIIKSLPTMHFLELHGGEPTLHDGIWEVVQAAIDGNYAKNIFVEVHTNLLKLEEWQIELLNQFKRLKVGISIDAYDEENHYIRYPSNWDTINEKMKLLRALDNEKVWIRINSVIQFFNAATLYKLCWWLDEINTEYDLGVEHGIGQIVRVLHYRAEMLPKELRIKGATELKRFIKESNLCNIDSPHHATRYGKSRVKQQKWMYQSQIDMLEKDYDIEEMNRDLGKNVVRKYDYNLLLNQTLTLDKIRKTDYRKVLPHLPDLNDLVIFEGEK
jgi:molybdenum cofactor biosynthesis enzyme MoaA